MKITTKHTALKGQLNRLIAHPIKDVTVTRVATFKERGSSFTTYEVKCKNLLDLMHACRSLNDHTASTNLG